MEQRPKRVPVTFIPAPVTPPAPVKPVVSKPIPVQPPAPAPVEKKPPPPRPRVAPIAEAAGFHWIWHVLVAGMLAMVVSITYGNSFQSLWTLDNKYIIQLDPRNKLATYDNLALVWTQDYWWPKGISGLYRPIPTMSYLLNWAEPFSWDPPPGAKDSPAYQTWRKLFTKAAGFDADNDSEKLAQLKKKRTEEPPSLGQRFAEWCLSWMPRGGGPTVDGKNLKEEDQVVGFHWVNLIFHWLNAVLVYLLAMRVVKRFWVALFTAILFGVHPIATESVTNIIGRADLFATFSTLAVTLLYIRQTEKTGWNRTGLLALMVLAGVFGFFSKESSVAGIALLVLWDVAFRLRKGSLNLQWIGILGAVYLGVTTIATAYGHFVVYGAADPQKPDLVWPHVGTFIGLMTILVLRLLYLAMPKDSLTDRGIGIALALAGTVLLGLVYPPAFWLLPLLIVLDEVALGTGIPGMQGWRDANAPFVRWAMPYLIILPAVLTMFIVRHYVFFTSTPPEEPFLDNPLRGLDFMRSRLTAVLVMGKQLWLLIWPVTLSSDYSFDEIPLFRWDLSVWSNIKTLLLAVVFIGMVAAAVWARVRGHRAIFFWVFLFFLNYGPTGNFLIIIGSIMAERFMYLPLIGFAGAMILGIDALLRRAKMPLDFLPEEPVAARPWWRYTGHAVLAIALTLCGIRAYFRNHVWHNDRTLWEAAIQVSPRSFRCYQSLAFALFEENPELYIDRMIRLDEEGLKLVDSLPNELNSSRLYLHLGMYYTIKGDLIAKPDNNGVVKRDDPAMEWYRKAAFILERGSSIDRAFNNVNRARDVKRGKAQSGEQVADVGLSPVYSYMAIAYMKLGMWGEAIQALRYNLHLDPQDVDAYFRMAQVYLQQNNVREAAVRLMQAVVINESRMDAWNLLVQIYNAINKEKVPAYIWNEGEPRPRLNIENSLVRDHLCSAYREFTRTFLACKRPDMAQQSATVAKTSYKFPASLFDPIFQETIERVEPPRPTFFDPEKMPKRVWP